MKVHIQDAVFQSVRLKYMTICLSIRTSNKNEKATV